MPEINNLLANITPTDLTNFARAVPVRADFLLSTSVLPTRVIDNVKYRLRNQTLTIAAARYRSFSAPTPRIFTSGARSIQEGYLPPLGGKQEIEEFDIILDEISRGADDQRLLDALWNNVENQVLAIQARLELAAGDLLTDGILSISENGVILDADFAVPAGNKPTAGILWSSPATATPLTDELAWITVLSNAGKPFPARAVTSRTVFNYLLQNTEYRNAYWGGAVSGTTRPGLTIDQFNSVRGTYGLPPIEIYDVQIPVADMTTAVVTQTRPLPVNRFLLLPPDPATNLGETLYGLTAEGIALTMGENPGLKAERAGIVSSGSTSFDPVSIATKTNATAMPVLQDPAALIIAIVA